MRSWLLTGALTLGLALTAVAKPESVRTLRTGAHSGVQKPERVVIRTQVEFDSLWKRSQASKQTSEAAPKIDWSKELVLAVFLGSRNTGGYGVRIVDTREVDGKLEIKVEERRPIAGGVVSQGFTSPFHIAAVPASTLSVTWKIVSPATGG